MIVNAKPSGILSLGREGENRARSIRFDISHWVRDFGPGVVELVHQRSGDPYPYPVVVTQTGNEVLWNITATDTAMVGLGRCELQFYLGGVLAKSENWYTKVFESISASGDVIPDPEVSWVNEVVQAGANVKYYADKAEESAVKAEAATVNVPILGDNGNWFVWDKTLGEYVDTGVYSGGEAPYIGANGNWFIGTNDSGVPATGPRGPVGPEGPAGVQGEKGEAFTYEDFTPEQLNALKGAKGDPFTYEDFTAAQLEKLRGPSGKDGVDGKDGYTPVKGVDYFDGKDGSDGQNGKDGQNGLTPHIGSNGNWYIGTTDTGIPATGPAGKDGSDGKDGSVGPAGKDGAGVPTVTTANDGQFLRVVNGAWAASTIPNAEEASF